MSIWVNSGCRSAAEFLVPEAAGQLVVALQAAHHEQLLNSWGDCGSAYQLPGRSRTGTRKSRAPSGVDRVRYGVSTFTKRCSRITSDSR